MKKRVVGLGEVLWDLLPERRCLGGAPANFAYITTLMGDQGIVASRVGEDSQGLEALRRLEELGLDIDHVQTDRERPTGTVKVEIEGDGVARFEIAHPVAWDALAWTLDWQHLAARVDAVCFGSLAQRAETSRATIQHFLHAVSPDAVKVFDVNLRQAYYSQEVLAESMRMADIVKLNDEELPRIMSLAKFPHKDELSSAHRLISAYDLTSGLYHAGRARKPAGKRPGRQRAPRLSCPGGGYRGIGRRVYCWTGARISARCLARPDERSGEPGGRMGGERGGRDARSEARSTGTFAGRDSVRKSAENSQPVV